MKKLVERAVSSLVTSWPARLLSTPALRLTQYVLSLSRLEVVDFGQRPDRTQTARFVRHILTMFEGQTMSVDEGYTLYSAVQTTAKVEGDLAEVGVFRGQSARIICEAKGDKRLHLFDTFQGLPTPAPIDSAFKEGQFACSLPAVQKLLVDQPDVRYYPGLFPTTAEVISDRRFSFVHLDVDLYTSTRAALEFFYPRMSPGAIILSHDFVTSRGVRQAFDEFFEHRAETVLELSGNQCLVVRLGQH